MKLRNKKTGEIVEICKICPEPYEARDFDCNSLAELNEEWGDYEEPKEYWFLSTRGEPHRFEGEDKIYTPNRKSIGNYFETKEEADKAVEKLKAWKRLKDKGFRFRDFARLNDCATVIRATFDESWSEIYDDLDLLFGGEE